MKNLKKQDFKEKEEAIRKASRHIMIAGSLIYGSASGLKPFRLSKLFNMMGKELHQQRLVLLALLDGTEIDVRLLELKMHSSQILKALIEDEEV